MFDNLPLILAQEDLPPPPANPQAPAPGVPGTPAVPGDPAGIPGAPTTLQPGPGAPGTPGAPLQQQAQPQSPFGNMFFFVLMAALILMFVFSMRSQSKEKKKRQALIDSIKRGDKVQTVGGLIATVVDLRENDVVLKIDEGNNTKATFARSAIQNVVKSKDE